MPNVATALLKGHRSDLRAQIEEAHRYKQAGRFLLQRCKDAADALAVLVGRSDDIVREAACLKSPAGLLQAPAANLHFIGGARTFAGGEVVSFTALPTHRLVVATPAPQARRPSDCALSDGRSSRLHFAPRWAPRIPAIRTTRQLPRRDIQPGDVVEMRPGGGSRMTVRTIFEAVALCSWLDPHGRKCTDVFLRDSLQAYAPSR